MTELKFGMFSRELGDHNSSDVALDKLEHWCDNNRDIDLVVCAGYTFPRRKRFNQFAERFKHGRTLIACEVCDKNASKVADGTNVSANLFLVGGGDVKDLRNASQKAIKACQFLDENIALYTEKAFGLRQFRVNGMSVLWISCGEINVLEGRRANIRMRVDTEGLRKLLRDADIVINPMHDRMKRLWVANDKGVALSLGHFGRKDLPRLYCRTANWNSEKRQRFDNTLHLALWRGETIKLIAERQGQAFFTYGVIND